MPPTTFPNGPPATTMRIIRVAIAFPVLAFAAVAWYLWSSGQRTPPPEGNEALGWAAYALAAGVVLVMFLFRGRATAAPERAQRATFTIIGWSLGEAAAMMGVVVYFILGQPMLMLPGLAALGVALVAFPVPGDAPARS